MREPTTNAAPQGSVHRPPLNGEKPSTSWRYCGRKKNPPNITRIAPHRSRATRGTQECGRARDRSADRPDAFVCERMRHRSRLPRRWKQPRSDSLHPARCPSARRSCSAPRSSDIAALSRSILPALGSRYSGSRIGPTISSSPMIGTLSKNTDPHQKCSSMTPPIRGPIAPPTE